MMTPPPAPRSREECISQLGVKPMRQVGIFVSIVMNAESVVRHSFAPLTTWQFWVGIAVQLAVMWLVALPIGHTLGSLVWRLTGHDWLRMGLWSNHRMKLPKRGRPPRDF